MTGRNGSTGNQQRSTSQRWMSALFYGGNTRRPVSWFVALEKEAFIPLLYPGVDNFYYKPAPYPEYPVLVHPIAHGPNLMLP